MGRVEPRLSPLLPGLFVWRGYLARFCGRVDLGQRVVLLPLALMTAIAGSVSIPCCAARRRIRGDASPSGHFAHRPHGPSTRLLPSGARRGPDPAAGWSNAASTLERTANRRERDGIAGDAAIERVGQTRVQHQSGQIREPMRESSPMTIAGSADDFVGDPPGLRPWHPLPRRDARMASYRLRWPGRAKRPGPARVTAPAAVRRRRSRRRRRGAQTARH